jgi:hypothetical protein
VNEQRPGTKIGCIKEAPYRMNYISEETLLKLSIDGLTKRFS